MVLENSQGDVLLTRRKPDTHLPNLWEFPGGKVESNENLIDAIKRESLEEINHRISKADKILTIEHPYPKLHVTLHVFHEISDNPTVVAAENQPMRWVKKSQLIKLNFPTANLKIIKYLQKTI